MFFSSKLVSIKSVFSAVKLQEDKTVGICNIELNFHKQRTNVDDVQPTDFFEDQVMPERFEMLMDMPNFECKPLEFMTFQGNLMNVTERILSMFRMRKMSVLHEDVKTKSPLFLDEYQHDHRGPSDSISSYNSLCARKLRMDAMRKQKKVPVFKRTHEDFYRMRTREECLEELAHMEVVINNLMQPELKKARLAGLCPLKPLKKSDSCEKFNLNSSERGGGDADLPKKAKVCRLYKEALFLYLLVSSGLYRTVWYVRLSRGSQIFKKFRSYGSIFNEKNIFCMKNIN